MDRVFDPVGRRCGIAAVVVPQRASHLPGSCSSGSQCRSRGGLYTKVSCLIISR